MAANLIASKELREMENGQIALATGQPPATKWLLVGAQGLALLAYAFGLAFLAKTTAGTLVLFSLLAPVLVVVILLTLIGVAIVEFRRRHSIAGFENYNTGEIIFRQGELGDCAYFIQSGEVEVLRHENGSENVIAKLSEGEYFGERALITSAPRSTTTRATTQTQVGIIRKRRFLTMVIVMPFESEQVRRKKRMTERTRKYAF